MTKLTETRTPFPVLGPSAGAQRPDNIEPVAARVPTTSHNGKADPSSPAAPRPAVASASSGLSQEIPQHDVVEPDIRHQPLQLRVLVLKPPQTFGV